MNTGVRANLPDRDSDSSRPGKRDWFASTHWSVVLAASHSDSTHQAAALEQLCRTYWYPLYLYIRRRGNGPEDAQDLTQEFFARLLAKQWLDGIEKNGSRFRSFLLSALNGFLANQYDRANAAKRVGDRQALSLDAEQAERRYLLEPVTNETPEKVFDRRWALTVLDRALTRLKDETAAAGKARQFEMLNPFLSREPETGEYAALAAEMNVSTGAVGVSVHRLRQRYRETVRAEIADTVANPAHVDGEMRELFAALRS
jgi:RNA polymerase sigma-70 factor (ECF subfamily)